MVTIVEAREALAKLDAGWNIRYSEVAMWRREERMLDILNRAMGADIGAPVAAPAAPVVSVTETEARAKLWEAITTWADWGDEDQQEQDELRDAVNDAIGVLLKSVLVAIEIEGLSDLEAWQLGVFERRDEVSFNPSALAARWLVQAYEDGSGHALTPLGFAALRRYRDGKARGDVK